MSTKHVRITRDVSLREELESGDNDNQRTTSCISIISDLFYFRLRLLPKKILFKYFL